jgi:hypothetical protein
MPNYSLISLQSQMLQDQANSRMGLLLGAYADPQQIQSQGDLIGAITDVFVSFYANLGRPLTMPIVFNGLPIADEWNLYQQQVIADLGILYVQTVDIENGANQALLYSTVETAMLGEAANSLQALVNTYTATRPTRLGLQSWTVSDNFQDNSKVDGTSCSNIVVLNNEVELASTGSSDFSKYVTLSIDDEYVKLALAAVNNTAVTSPGGASNGFVGNTHEVTVPENTNPLTTSNQTGTSSSGQDPTAGYTGTGAPTGSPFLVSSFYGSGTDGGPTTSVVQQNPTPGSTIAFVGDSGMHGDVSVLIDGNSATWFEYEVCNIPDTLKANPCNYYGFDLEVPTPGTQTTKDVPWWQFHGLASRPLQPLAFFPPPATTQKINQAAPEVDATGMYIQPNAAAAVDVTLAGSTSAYVASGTGITLTQGGAPETGGVLTLALLATFSTPQTLTQISLTPNILNNKPPTFVSVEVSTPGVNGWISATQVQQQAVVPSTTSTAIEDPTTVPPAVSLWQFPSTLVSQARIVVQQTQSYQTNIGHIVWAQQVQGQGVTDPALLSALMGTSISFDNQGSTAVYYERVDGPLPNYEDILESAGTVLSTITGISSYLPGTGGSGNQLNSSSSSSSQLIGPLVEAFPGWRYAISLSDIAFGGISYATSGVFTSVNFTVPIDIKLVSLNVTELIPETTTTVSGNWITYSFSLDGGSTWTQISPQSHYSSSTPRTFLVNPSTTSTLTAQNAGTVTTSGYNAVSAPAQQICLQATFAQLGAETSVTPRLQAYSLILEGEPLS